MTRLSIGCQSHSMTLHTVLTECLIRMVRRIFFQYYTWSQTFTKYELISRISKKCIQDYIRARSIPWNPHGCPKSTIRISIFDGTIFYDYINDFLGIYSDYFWFSVSLEKNKSCSYALFYPLWMSCTLARINKSRRETRWNYVVSICEKPKMKVEVDRERVLEKLPKPSTLSELRAFVWLPQLFKKLIQKLSWTTAL